MAAGLEAPAPRRRSRVALIVRAAGGIVRRVGSKGLEVVLVHRPAYDDWTFPKGKAAPGETDEQTAVREVEEETSLRCLLGRELPSARYRDKHGRDKLVRYWTMAIAEAGVFEPGREVDELRWLTPELASSELSYERDRTVLDGAAGPLLVVRHGSAGDRSDWGGDDTRRPLDEHGRREAEGLVGQLEPFTIRRLVSSPFDRCVETVQPLARARGLEVELADELAEGSDPSLVRKLLLGLGPEAVVCMHRPELEPLFGKVKKGATVGVEQTESELLELGRLPPPK
jgi:8-oxo-(d)GTP phosphatase